MPTMTDPTSVHRLLEIRTYRLKPGTLEAFHAAMRDVSAPMLRRSGMDVVAYGRSNHEEESYFLVRAYKDRAALESEQSAFYTSAEWTQGPRSMLVDKIDTYVNTLLWCSEEGVEAMRRLNSSEAA
jgi:quinol monooxygenase YgiN